jgi:hypothetical protein
MHFNTLQVNHQSTEMSLHFTHSITQIKIIQLQNPRNVPAGQPTQHNQSINQPTLLYIMVNYLWCQVKSPASPVSSVSFILSQ